MPNTLIRSGYLDSDRTCLLSDAADRFYFRSHLACDDAGRLDGRPGVLVSELFKAQNRARFTAPKAEKCIAECVAHGLYHPYVWDGKPYLQITRYHRRSPSTRSKYPWVDGSYTIEYERVETRDGSKEFVKTSLLKYHSNGDGCPMGAGTHADGLPMGPSRAIDGDGDDRRLVASSEATLSAKADLPTLADFAAAWNEHVQAQKKGGGTKIGTMREDLAGDSRRKHWASRLKEPEFVANWRAILEKAFAGDFLNGRARSGRDWCMSPDWLLRNNDNYRKVLEGKYDNKSGAGAKHIADKDYHAESF